MISKLYFFSLNIKKNSRFMLFLLVQYLLGFTIIHSGIEEIFVSCLAKMNYVYMDEQNSVVWLNGAISNNTHGDDLDIFFDSLYRNKHVAGFGYIHKHRAFADNKDVDLEGLDKISCKWKLRLKEGTWFDNNDSTLQFILGGEISQNHTIGDVLEISIPFWEGNSKISYKEYTGKIIGLLNHSANTISLDLSGTEPTFVDILNGHDNIILTNRYDIVDAAGGSPSLASLLIEYSGDYESAAYDLKKYGECITIEQINKYTKQYLKSVLSDSFPSMILILMMVIYGVISIGYIFIYRNSINMAVYELCGQSDKSRKKLIILINALPMIMGLILSFCLLKIPTIKNFLRIYSDLSYIHILISLLAAILFMSTIMVSVNLSFKKSTIANIRRTE